MRAYAESSDLFEERGPIVEGPVAAVAEAIGEPAPGEIWGAKLLDLRGVAKPPLFDGRPLSYADWRF
eukprot:575303-Heterocapsa_arctica.AAC.1